MIYHANLFSNYSNSVIGRGELFLEFIKQTKSIGAKVFTDNATKGEKN